MYNSNYC